MRDNGAEQSAEVVFPPPGQTGLPTGLEAVQLFLKTIFGDGFREAHVTGFLGDPTSRADGRWGGGHYERLAPTLSPQHNLYVTVSTFRPDPAGKDSRSLSQFKRFHALMIDDIGRGQKIPPGAIPDRVRGSGPAGAGTVSYPCGRATALVETSPGNFQAWYALSEDLSPRAAAWLQDSVLAKLDVLRDPGMLGLNRYGRLPGGSNTKASVLEKNDGKPWSVRLHSLQALLRYTLTDLCEIFGIDPPTEVDLAERTDRGTDLDADTLDAVIQSWIKAATDAGLEPVPGRRDGTWLIHCPWTEDHTDKRPDRSAAFSVPDANRSAWFKCHHGHCEHRTLYDFLRYLKQGSTLVLSHRSLPGTAGFDPVKEDDLIDIEAPPAPIDNYAITTVRDIWSRKIEVPLLISGLGIPAQGVSVLAGLGGVGKSTLALQLASCVVLGEAFIGECDILRPGPVLIYAGEDVASVAGERLNWLRQDLRWSDSAISRIEQEVRFIHRPEIEVAADLDVRARVKRILAQDAASLVLQYTRNREVVQPLDAWGRFAHALSRYPGTRMLILDPKVLVDLSEENDAYAQASFMSRLHQFAVDFDLCILLIHHTTKAAARAEVVDAEMVRGSGAIVNEARHVMTLSKKVYPKGQRQRPNRLSLSVVKTNYGPLADYTLFHIGGAAMMPDLSREEVGPMADDLTRLYTMLSEHPEGRLPAAAELAKRLHLRRQAITDMITTLFREGIVSGERVRYLAEDHAARFAEFTQAQNDLLS